MSPLDDPAEEELRLGPRHRRRPDWPLRSRERLLVALILVVAAAVAVPLLVTSGGSKNPSAARKHPPPASPPASSPVSTPSPPAPMLSRPAVRKTRRFVLGVHGPWELFARGDRSIVRIQFARGRVTTTEVPELASSGAVSFVVGTWGALVRPYDFVPGYLIPDGRRAGEPGSTLDCGGPALPGPRPSTLWVGTCSDRVPRMFLTRLDGMRTGISLRIPRGRSPIAALPDGRGFVLFPGSETVAGSPATVDVRPGGTSVVTRHDHVIAVGSTMWLLERCASQRCSAVVVNRSTGSRRKLPAVVPPVQVPGTISPDGRSAAFVDVATKPTSVAVLDLATGDLHVTPISADVTDSQTMAWSPDSRVLFALDRHGIVYAVRRPVGEGMALTALTPWLHLPTLRQLAIRDLTAR